LDKAKYISIEKSRELEKYRVREHDLLFSRMATVGRAGLVTKQFEGMIFNYHLMLLRIEEKLVDPSFFLYYVRGSKKVTDYVKEVNHGATRDGINTEQLLSMPVTLPPLDEQRKIVTEVERRLSIANKVETAVEAGLKRAELMRQAILKLAFKGMLVR
jgi:type I restriction enzyme S subunit